MSEATALEKTQNSESNGLIPAAENEVSIERQKFELAQRKAAIYAQSTLVPDVYRNNIGNVLIADNMARRMGADLLMVMQNLYVVQGRPGWSSPFLIASFNTNGKFTALKYRFKGDPQTPEWGCQAYATEIATGQEIAGTWITWEMATKEGWTTKNGSKWKTMPEQMFRYRAAAFLIRATAPEIGMGLLTKDEIEDTLPSNGESTAAKAGVAGLKNRLSVVDETTDEDPATIDGSIVEEESAEPDVAHTDAVVEPEGTTAEEGSAIEAEAEKATSTLIDLRTAASDLLDSLTGDRLEAATAFLDGKSVRSLDRIRVTEFLEKFQ